MGLDMRSLWLQNGKVTQMCRYQTINDVKLVQTWRKYTHEDVYLDRSGQREWKLTHALRYKTNPHQLIIGQLVVHFIGAAPIASFGQFW